MPVGKKVKIGVGLALAGYMAFWFINNFVYPFFPESPNFKDVERVFSRMQFPAEWEELDSTENRGLAGRACPIEPGSRCFQKGKKFRVDSNIDQKIVEEVFKQTGCSIVSIQRSEPIGGTPYSNFECSVDGLKVDGGVTETSAESWEVSVYVST